MRKKYITPTTETFLMEVNNLYMQTSLPITVSTETIDKTDDFEFFGRKNDTPSNDANAWDSEW